MAARIAVAAGIAGTVAVVGGIVGVVAITDAGTHTDEPGTRVSIAKIQVAPPPNPLPAPVKTPSDIPGPTTPETVQAPDPREVGTPKPSSPISMSPISTSPTSDAAAPNSGGATPPADVGGTANERRRLAPTNPGSDKAGVGAGDNTRLRAPIRFGPSLKHHKAHKAVKDHGHDKGGKPHGHDKGGKPHGHDAPPPGDDEHGKSDSGPNTDGNASNGNGNGNANGSSNGNASHDKAPHDKAPHDNGKDKDFKTQSRHSSPASRG